MATVEIGNRERGGGEFVDCGRPATRAARRRAGLVAAVLLAVAAAVLLGQPRPDLAADPDLAFVLRGMGAIKAVIALAVLALLWWQVAGPITMPHLLGYLAAGALLAASAVLVLKLAVLLATSIVFHATLLTLGLMALGDGNLRHGTLRAGVGLPSDRGIG